MQKKQTAIQYAKQSLEQLADAVVAGDIKLTDLSKITQKIWNEALQQEREQNGLTWDTAIFKHNQSGFNPMRTYEKFDEYYNETFEK